MFVYLLGIIEGFSLYRKCAQSPVHYLSFLNQAAGNRIELMKRTVDELKCCKAGLRLPEGAENTLSVFSSADLLMNKLLELEQVSTRIHTHIGFVICVLWVSKSVVSTFTKRYNLEDMVNTNEFEILELVARKVDEKYLRTIFLTFEQDQHGHSQGQIASASVYLIYLSFFCLCNEKQQQPQRYC